MPSETPNEYSSLPLTIGIAGVILVSAAVGWFVLGGSTPAGGNKMEKNTLLALAEVQSVNTTDIDIDSELRKARLSADADLLVTPPGQNALYFYSRVLQANPNHPVATAELDALLAAISLLVDDHLTDGDFDAAYDLATKASVHKSDHALVEKMRGELNAYVAALADDASRLAAEGKDDEATAIVAIIERMPGLSTDYVESSRQAVLDVQQSRIAAEQEEIEAAQRASEEAELEWAQKVRDAIAAGKLIGPESESARDYITGQDAPDEVKTELTSELQDALVASIRAMLDSDELSDIDHYLLAAADLNVDAEILATLHADLDQHIIERERNRRVPLTDFVRIAAPPANYPLHARRLEITGSVDVAFTVTATGETADIEIVRAEPERVFDSAVIDAVEKWTFVPRQVRGQPIDQPTAARLVFNLE